MNGYPGTFLVVILGVIVAEIIIVLIRGISG